MRNRESKRDKQAAELKKVRNQRDRESDNMDRTNRISEEMKKEISAIIQSELKDPRLPKMISVTSAEVTRDLRYAKVFISVFGNEADKKNAIEGLKSAAGFIRREVGHRLQLRYSPELLFELDDSIERGVYITKLINDTVNGK
jgi:ribosome-binding factor A